MVLNNEQKISTYLLGSSRKSKATAMKTFGTTLFGA
jgi:hypothetical protein